MMNEEIVDRIRNWKGSIYIVSAECGHGEIGIDGHLGYEESYVTNPYEFDCVISAHANSKLLIITSISLMVKGFLNGTAKYCDGVEFLLNKKSVGVVTRSYDVTVECRIEPGVHLLEAVCIGSNGYCHTVWGFSKAGRDGISPVYELAIGSVLRKGDVIEADWINYHLNVGVEHIFLVADPSEMLPEEIDLEEFRDYITWWQFDSKEEVGGGKAGYQFLLKRFGPYCEWMALVNSGEYINPHMGGSVARMLNAYVDFGGLRLINESGSFGFSEHELNPERGGVERQSSAPDLRYIIRPRFVLMISGFDNFEMMRGREIVGESFADSATSLHVNVDRRRGANKVSPNLMREDNFSRFPRRVLDLPHMEDGNLVDECIKVVGFIHIAAVNHWRSILLSQIEKMRASGLYDRTEKIKIGLVGASASIADEVRRISDKIEIIACSSNLRDYEFPTLMELENHCLLFPSDYVWYIHTKGVVNRFERQDRWRLRMEQFILTHFDIAIDRLNSGYGVAATYGSAEPLVHAPGNFWWARARFINELPRLETFDLTDRYNAEAWIGMNGSSSIYWNDSGDTILDYFEILKFQVGAGFLTTNGFLGWNRLPMILFPAWTVDRVLSAHAPSWVLIKCIMPLTVFGFISRTAERGDWLVEFRVDGVDLGRSELPGERSLEIYLEAGEHLLESMVVEGEAWGAHTCWGLLRGNHVAEKNPSKGAESHAISIVT